jgi:hypothetical protein
MEMEVQYNTPNPDCDEQAFRRLYIDVDPSKFDPVAADAQEWKRIREWRRGMDGVWRKS